MLSDQFSNSLILVFFIGCVFLSLFTFRKVKNIREYALGRANYSLPMMAGTIFATSISSYSTIGTIEKIIGCGFFFIITFLTKPIFFILMGAILSRGANKFNGCISISDIMEKMYGKEAGIITAVMAIIMSIGMVSIQIFAIKSILKFVGLTSNTYLILAPLCFILYSALGGIRVVSVIDLFKFLVLFTVLPISCIKCLSNTNGIDGIYAALGDNYFTLNMPKTELFSLISILLFNAIPGMTPPIIQRSLMLQTKEQIMKAFTISGLLTIPLFAMVTLIGLAARVKGLGASSGALEILLPADPYGLSAVVLIGLFTIIIGTADSYLNTASIIFTKSLIKKIKPTFETLRTVRISNLLIGCVALLVSMSKINIVDFFLTINNFWLPIVLVPMIVGYGGFIPTNKNVFFSAFLGGIVFSIAGYFYVGSIGAFTTLAGLLGSGFFLWVYSYTLIPLKTYYRPNIKFGKYFFISHSSCLSFSLWSLLFCIWGCLTLFYTGLISFFIVGTILSVVLLLSEHVVKNNFLLSLIISSLWHIGWSIVLFCFIYSIFLIDAPIISLGLYLISGMVVCYVLSSFENIILPTFCSLILFFCANYNFTTKAHSMPGIYFVNGVICLSFLTMVFAWFTIRHKNINLNKEFAGFEKTNHIKIDAEKKFVANMHLALNDVLQGGRALPIKIPVKNRVEEIFLQELCRDLQNFISLDAAKMNINFEILANTEKITLNISNSYLCQLLFSMVYNMIYLVNTGSIIRLELNFDEKEFYIKLKYSGISFSKDELIKFTKGRKYINAFMLNFSDIFDCLNDINAFYTIEKNLNDGTINIKKLIYNNIVKLPGLS